MPAIVLTDSEIADLRKLLDSQTSGFAKTGIALAHPLPDLTDFMSDIREIVSRARDGSSYISEDFHMFLTALDTVDGQLAKLAKAQTS
jgi:hypothetical protein